MDINHVVIDRTIVIALVGRLDSQSAPSFEKQLYPLLSGHSGVVLDLAGLDYISSAGLRMVLLIANAARQIDAKLALCHLKPHVREVFEVSGILNIMTVCEHRADAQATVGAKGS